MNYSYSPQNTKPLIGWSCMSTNWRPRFWREIYVGNSFIYALKWNYEKPIFESFFYLQWIILRVCVKVLTKAGRFWQWRYSCSSSRLFILTVLIGCFLRERERETNFDKVGVTTFDGLSQYSPEVLLLSSLSLSPFFPFNLIEDEGAPTLNLYIYNILSI